MAIYSNENIKKIAKIKPSRIPQPSPKSWYYLYACEIFGVYSVQLFPLELFDKESISSTENQKGINSLGPS